MCRGSRSKPATEHNVAAHPKVRDVYLRRHWQHHTLVSNLAYLLFIKNRMYLDGEMSEINTKPLNEYKSQVERVVRERTLLRTAAVRL